MGENFRETKLNKALYSNQAWYHRSLVNLAPPHSPYYAVSTVPKREDLDTGKYRSALCEPTVGETEFRESPLLRRGAFPDSPTEAVRPLQGDGAGHAQGWVLPA